MVTQENTNSDLPPTETRSGLCQCGCGQPTPISTENRPRNGYLKGQPLKFVRGHYARPSVENRFWSKVDMSCGPDACWPWKAGTFAGGYGKFWDWGRMKLAHRVAFELANGALDDEDDVRHRVCDNPPCCNPAHLECGSHAENMADMVEKGRQARGENNGKSKFTHAQVDSIRARYAAREASQRQLAREHGVQRKTIQLIVQGARY